MALYNEVLPEFRKHDPEVSGIPVDGVWCHEAYAKQHKLHFPLVADFHPKGKVAKSYRAYRKNDGVCERAIFVIDRQGEIALDDLGAAIDARLAPRQHSSPARVRMAVNPEPLSSAYVDHISRVSRFLRPLS